MKKILFAIFLCLIQVSFSQQEPEPSFAILKGKVISKVTGKPIPDVAIRISNSSIGDYSNIKGEYNFMLPFKHSYQILFTKVGFKPILKNVKFYNPNDSLTLNISLQEDTFSLKGAEIVTKRKADTVFNNWRYSVIDYAFYEDKFILLTNSGNTEKSTLRLVTENKTQLYDMAVPILAGASKEFFVDFLDDVNLICEFEVYKLSIEKNKIKLTARGVDEFNAFIKPCVDTMNQQILFSDYKVDYPEFTYKLYNPLDSSVNPLITVADKDLLSAYRMEYFALKPRQRLDAKNIASDYKVDKFRVAAAISGFTSSLFYTPLYAPIYIIQDTLMVFDHYTNYIYKFNKAGKKIDSTAINYHHSENWKFWKNKLIKDLVNDKVYAIFNNSSRYFIKGINVNTGAIRGTYKPIQPNADKFKIRNGYLYYTYRPIESLQERFLYKEQIILNQ